MVDSRLDSCWPYLLLARVTIIYLENRVGSEFGQLLQRRRAGAVLPLFAALLSPSDARMIKERIQKDHNWSVAQVMGNSALLLRF